METPRKSVGGTTPEDWCFGVMSHHLKTSIPEFSKTRVIHEDNPRLVIERLHKDYLTRDARRGLTGRHRAAFFFADDLDEGVVFGRDEAETLFRDLADRWRRETGHLSSVTQIVLNQSYQQIIGLGSRVIPLLLAELRREPDHWFWALSAITREDPIDPENAGDVERMAEDWLAWGSKRGYLSK